ncbi:unnamed protein product [Cochlearia groenlandica]
MQKLIRNNHGRIRLLRSKNRRELHGDWTSHNPRDPDKPGAIYPPHYHPRTISVAHVVKGRVYSDFVDSTNNKVYSKGLVHFQMNVGHVTATIFVGFNSQNPGIQKIPSLVFGSGINEELLMKAFGMSLKQIGTLKRRFDHGMYNKH